MNVRLCLPESPESLVRSSLFRGPRLLPVLLTKDKLLRSFGSVLGFVSTACAVLCRDSPYILLPWLKGLWFFAVKIPFFQYQFFLYYLYSVSIKPLPISSSLNVLSFLFPIQLLRYLSFRLAWCFMGSMLVSRFYNFYFRRSSVISVGAPARSLLHCYITTRFRSLLLNSFEVLL